MPYLFIEGTWWEIIATRDDSKFKISHRFNIKADTEAEALHIFKELAPGWTIKDISQYAHLAGKIIQKGVL